MLVVRVILQTAPASVMYQLDSVLVDTEGFQIVAKCVASPAALHSTPIGDTFENKLVCH